MPSKFTCETCDKTIAYKDRAAHERGKKHKQIVADIQAKEKAKAAAQSNTGHGDNAGAPADPNACHNCGVGKFFWSPSSRQVTDNYIAGHMARDCTEPRKPKLTGECFNCGRAG